MKLNEITQPRNILVIGGSGTGKTHLIGTLCELMPKTLVVTSDSQGLQTLTTMGFNPEVIIVEDWLQIWKVFSQVVVASRDFDCIALDDFGAMQKTAERKVVLEPKGWADDKLIKEKGITAFRQKAREQLLLGERRMQIQQWGELFTALESFTSEVLRLPFKVKLFTTLEGMAKNPRTGDDHIYPQLSGQVRTTFPARFSLVAETFISALGDGSRLYYSMTCRSHSRIETKSRFGEGRTWVNPSMAKVLAYINHKGVPETEDEKKIGTGL